MSIERIISGGRAASIGLPSISLSNSGSMREAGYRGEDLPKTVVCRDVTK
jgi:hypothetical protein